MMERNIIFEGKVTIANRLVDFRIYEHKDGKGNLKYYSYATNPWLRDASQLDFHFGEILRGETLERLLFRFRSEYLKEFTQIAEEKENTNF